MFREINSHVYKYFAHGGASDQATAFALRRAGMPASRRQDVGAPTSTSSYKLPSSPSAPDHARRKRQVAPAPLDTA